jgi:hypothetical protein
MVLQLTLRAFLSIYLAHLAADFVFQTHGLVERKQRGQPLAYLLHGLTHYLCAVLILGFFVPGSITALHTHLVLAGLALLHLLLDFAKVQFAAKGLLRAGAGAFLADQFAHFLTVLFAVWLLLPAESFTTLVSLAQIMRGTENKLLAVPIVYLAVVFGGGYLIRALTRPMADVVKLPESGEQLQNAGLYIGWLERFLILTALLLQSPSAVGLVLAIKAIARYPEFKSVRFAEYVIIGTLLSLSVAFLGALVLAWVLPSTAHLLG